MLKRFLNIPPGSVLNSASAVNRSTSISSSRSSTDTRLGSLARMWTLYHWSGSRLLIVCWNVPRRTVLWRSPFRRISWLNELLPGDHSILADVGEMQVTCTWLGAKFASEGRKQTVGKKSDETYQKNIKNKLNWNDSPLPSNLTCRSLKNLKNFNLNINTISLSSSYRYNDMQTIWLNATLLYTANLCQLSPQLSGLMILLPALWWCVQRGGMSGEKRKTQEKTKLQLWPVTLNSD